MERLTFCDTAVQVGSLLLEKEEECHMYGATLLGKRGVSLEVCCWSETCFAIIVMIGGVPFEEHPSYSKIAPKVSWKGDFEDGCLDLTDAKEFHRVVMALCEILGCRI